MLHLLKLARWPRMRTHPTSRQTWQRQISIRNSPCYGAPPTKNQWGLGFASLYWCHRSCCIFLSPFPSDWKIPRFLWLSIIYVLCTCLSTISASSKEVSCGQLVQCTHWLSSYKLWFIWILSEIGYFGLSVPVNPSSISSILVCLWLYMLTVSGWTHWYFLWLNDYNILLYKSYYVSWLRRKSTFLTLYLV